MPQSMEQLSNQLKPIRMQKPNLPQLVSDKNKSEWRDSNPQICMQKSSREDLNKISSLQEQALANKQMI